MTNEEKAAMVNFFGTIHAQAKQNDQMIVQGAQHIRPISQNIQHEFERALQTVQHQEMQQHYAPPQYQQGGNSGFYQDQGLPPLPAYEPPQLIPMPPGYEQSPVQQEFQFNAPPPVASAPVLQPMYNEDIVNILKEISLTLNRIGDIMESKNVKTKRTTTPKSESN